MRLATCFICLWLGSCGLVPGRETTQQSTSLESVSVLAAVDANQGSATALDLVFVYDASAIALLPGDVDTWFAKRSELSATLQTSLDIVSTEIPSAFFQRSFSLPERHDRALKVVAYAHYSGPGCCLPIDLTHIHHAQLTLEANTVLLSEVSTDFLVEPKPLTHGRE